MKTLYLTLSFLIQLCLFGQNDRMLPVVGGKKEDSKEKKTQNSLPDLVSKGASEALHKTSTGEKPSYKRLDSALLPANNLLVQADELDQKEAEVRKKAIGLKGSERSKILDEAGIIRSQASMKRILASEITGKVNYDKFQYNERVIGELNNKGVRRESVVQTIEDMTSAARSFMKAAREIREEANSVKNTPARLGMMSNAEEKEYIALEKQEGAIGLLKSTAAVVKDPDPMMAHK